MAKNLLMVLLLTLVGQVFCLQCNTCHGEYNCVGEKMTCKGSSASCTTSVRKAHVSFLEFQTVRKGCARQLYPSDSFSLSSHLMTLSYQANFCSEDGCNNETSFVSPPAPTNHMRCHTCTSQGAWCPEASRTQISCVGSQDQCVDLAITGKLGPYSNLKLKGCTNLPCCEESLSFHSESQTIHASCCNTPLCNTFTPDLYMESQPSNGLECYSCADGQGSGAGCSKKTISKVKCTGVRNMCLEGIGKSRKAGEEVSLVTFKGCASPAMCRSSLFELVQELEDADVICCQGNLCNNRIVDGVITEPQVPADSPKNMEDVECPVFDLTPAELMPKSDCFYSDEVEDGNMEVVNSPTSEVPSPGNHTDKETVYMTDEKKASENFVNESNGQPPSHHDHTLVGGKAFEESLSGNSSESSETSSSAGSSPGSSSAITNLERRNSTSSDSHGGVALLIPFIVPNRDKTTSPTTSSPIKISPSKEVLAASSNDKDIASDKCETEEECLRGHFIATHEKDREVSPFTQFPDYPQGSENPLSTFSPFEEFAPNAGNFLREESSPASGSYSSSTENAYVSVSAVEEHGLPHSPAATTSESSYMEPGHGIGGESFIVDHSIPVSTPAGSTASSDGLASHVLPRLPIASKENSSFIVEEETKANASAAANAHLFANVTNIQTYLNTNMSNSITNLGMGLVAALSTSRPKTKTPCKHPECQNPPKVNLMTSSGAEEEDTRNASTSFLTDPKSPVRNTAGKGKPSSGALSLTFNFGLFFLVLVLAALT